MFVDITSISFQHCKVRAKICIFVMYVINDPTTFFNFPKSIEKSSACSKISEEVSHYEYMLSTIKSANASLV
jgi:hypothetical protein